MPAGGPSGGLASIWLNSKPFRGARNTSAPRLTAMGEPWGRVACDSKLSSVGYGAMCSGGGHWGRISEIRVFPPAASPFNRREGSLFANLFRTARIKQEGTDGVSSAATTTHERAGAERLTERKGRTTDATLRVRMPALWAHLRGLHPAPGGRDAAKMPCVREGRGGARPVLVLGQGERGRRMRDRLGSRLKILTAGPAAPLMRSETSTDGKPW